MSGQQVAWILDSGGAGRGAWQGGVLYEFMCWARANGRYPQISMGASAGGYAAGDVATGTEQTVMKGWTAWGREDLLVRFPAPAASARARPRSKFREHLCASIRYVMADTEVRGIFDSDPAVKLLIFTTRVKRRHHGPVRGTDLGRLFVQSLTRKLPPPLKYVPAGLLEEPVVFASHIPSGLVSEHVRPLVRTNYHRVIEASCLVPLAMGSPILPGQLASDGATADPGDRGAVFVDGGYALKMPMALFEEDARFRPLASWAEADRSVVFCCDPSGSMWETSSRLRRLNSHPSVARALAERRMLLIYPDHEVEAGFLCLENARTMRTFERGREQGRRLLGTDSVRRFMES